MINHYYCVDNNIRAVVCNYKQVLIGLILQCKIPFECLKCKGQLALLNPLNVHVEIIELLCIHQTGENVTNETGL